MKFCLKSLCITLLVSQCFLASEQAWSSDKKKKKPAAQEQKVHAKKAKHEADDKNAQKELKEMEETLAGFSKTTENFNPDLREADLKSLVKTLTNALEDLEGRLKKLNVSEEERARVQKLIIESYDAINKMIARWGLRQKALAEEREKALSLQLSGTGYIEHSALTLT